MRRKFKYTFTRKEETEGGFFFIGFLPAAPWYCFWYLCASRFFWEGKAESWIGALGLMAVHFFSQRPF